MSQPSLFVAGCTVRAARRLVKQWHRHLDEFQGGLFAARVVDDAGVTRGVAVAGHPARVWMETGRICIARVATDECPNACSALYGAMCRAAKALGWREAWTYTLPNEPGTSLRGAGFVERGLTRGEEWGRKARPRSTKNADPKRRWVRVLNTIGPAEAARAEEA